MATIDFRSAFKRARRSPAYWVERAILRYTSAIAERLRRLQITQRELAARVEVSPAYVNKVLNGTPNLTIKSMVELAHAVGLTVEISLREGQLEDGTEIAWSEEVSARGRCYDVAETRVVDLAAANDEISFGQLQRAA